MSFEYKGLASKIIVTKRTQKKHFFSRTFEGALMFTSIWTPRGPRWRPNHSNQVVHPVHKSKKASAWMSQSSHLLLCHCNSPDLVDQLWRGKRTEVSEHSYSEVRHSSTYKVGTSHGELPISSGFLVTETPQLKSLEQKDPISSFKGVYF